MLGVVVHDFGFRRKVPKTVTDAPWQSCLSEIQIFSRRWSPAITQGSFRGTHVNVIGLKVNGKFCEMPLTNLSIM